jgi:polysaccharide export outer membrane protein
VIPFVSFFILFSIFLSYQPPVYALQTDTYKVGPSDIVRISVAGRSDINDAFPVSANGTINFPLLGNVMVAGLTTQKIEQKLTDLLGKDYLVNPRVYVAMEKYNSQKVIVWGEVKSPGIYVLTGETTLLEIIAQAGGMADEAGKRVQLVHNAPDVIASSDVNGAIRGAMSKQKPVVIDIGQVVKDGNPTGELAVASGDVIVVEAKKDTDINEQQVYVTGCLSKPGAYDYQNGLTAMSLCIIAGGFTNRAAPQRATLIRKVEREDKVYQINLDQVKRGKAIDFELKPGDRLNVPESFW